MRVRIVPIRLAVKDYMAQEEIGAMMPLNVIRVLGVKIGHVYGYENTRGGVVGIGSTRTQSGPRQQFRGNREVIDVTSENAVLAYDPRIGWCYLCLNSKRNPIGNFHVGYVPIPEPVGKTAAEPWVPDSQDWFPLDVEIEPNTQITGFYFNEAAFSQAAQAEDGTKYIVAIYFRCLVSDEDPPLEETLKRMAEYR